MIEVLKQALDALETEVSIDWTNNDEFNASAEKMHNAITSLRQAIAELESKEPVAWQERQAKRMKEGIVTEWSNWYSCDHRSINDARAEIYDHIPYEWRPLYAHPPQRTEQEPLANELAQLKEEIALLKYKLWDCEEKSKPMKGQ
jgi:hypothetical protein